MKLLYSSIVKIYFSYDVIAKPFDTILQHKFGDLFLRHLFMDEISFDIICVRLIKCINLVLVAANFEGRS